MSKDVAAPDSLEILKKYVSGMDSGSKDYNSIFTEKLKTQSSVNLSKEKVPYNPNEESTFAPKINPHSEKLAAGENGRGKDWWRHLYKDDLKKYE